MDGGGSISQQEVKETLTGFTDGEMTEEEQKMWDDLIAEIDLDGNGEIDFYEFCHMMRKMIAID